MNSARERAQKKITTHTYGARKKKTAKEDIHSLTHSACACVCEREKERERVRVRVGVCVCV